MASVDEGKRRLVLVPQATHELRQVLFQVLRHTQTHRNVQARLERLWKKATEGRADNRVFPELVVVAPDDLTNPLGVYVDELRRVVVRDLRLVEPTRQGEPAAWACNYLHCDIEPSSGKGEVATDLPHPALPPRPVEVWIERAALQLIVSPVSAAATLIGDDGQLASEFTFAAKSGYGDAEWNDLAKHAHDMLAEHLRRMRESYEAKNAALGHFEFRNPTRRLSESADMAVLADWLIGNKRPDHSTRERLRKRAKLLGIAFPPPPRAVQQK